MQNTKEKIFTTKDIDKFYLEVVCHEEKDIEKVKNKLLDLLPNLKIDSITNDRLFVQVKGGLGISYKELENTLTPMPTHSYLSCLKWKNLKENYVRFIKFFHIITCRIWALYMMKKIITNQ